MISYRTGGKRLFDFCMACVGLLTLFWLILGAVVVATFDTRAPGIFRQTRIGKHGKRFTIYKIRTMRNSIENSSVLTTRSDSRITTVGRIFRRLKIDELPQLVNIVLGDMSFVGPRPEVPEYSAMIYEQAPEIFNLRPGVTGPATIKYRNEEAILDSVDDVKKYNDEVILPDKIRINLEYLQHFSIRTDILYILKTLKLVK